MIPAHVTLAVLWLFFCVLHSVLASLTCKQWVAQTFSKAYAHYRLIYTIIAFVTFGVVVYYQVKVASTYLWQPVLASRLAGLFISAFGLIIMGICVKKYFLSLSGIRSLFEQKPSNVLMINGIHRFVRHPLYLGTFIFIWGFFIIQPHLSILISNFIITTYTLIGIRLEEIKLVKEFGKDYQTYQHTVPRLIPLLFKRGH